LRWLYHATRRAELPPGWTELRPPSLASEGFVHASYVGDVVESARLYLPASEELCVLRIDPRRVVMREDMTPRGPMPHVLGPIPRSAVVQELGLEEVAAAPDRVQGTRIAFVAFSGMTLLDLVGVLDPVSRIATMGFDPTLGCEVVAATSDATVFAAFGLRVTADRVRPPLASYDLVVVAGGPSARELANDPEVSAWLWAPGAGAWMASVCTGSLLLGAAGHLQGKRATTHATASHLLASYGATYVDERVVDEGLLVTAGGVTAGIDLGLHLVERLEGAETRAAIAKQMNVAR
jgi:putative intracellular protease/amidase/uncharacterized protein (DUF952 family)